MTSYLIDVYIEIPSGSNIKYEYDSDYKCVRCDRVLNTALVYPSNYGFVPNTIAGDGDPLDVLLISDYKLFPNTIIEAKIIGVLLTEDEKGEDHKIIAVPSNKVDPRYNSINNYNELDSNKLDKIVHFFKNYKTLDEKRWVKVTDYKDKDYALQIYKSSLLEEDSDNDNSEQDNSDHDNSEQDNSEQDNSEQDNDENSDNNNDD